MRDMEYIYQITLAQRAPRVVYEVFDPTDGLPLYRTRFAIVARIIAKVRGLDWAAQGDGWGWEGFAADRATLDSVHPEFRARRPVGEC